MEENRMFQQVIASYDAPAYVRRARKVAAAWDRLIERLLQERRRLGAVAAMRWLTAEALNNGTLDGLPGLSPEGQCVVRGFCDDMGVRLRRPVTPSTSAAVKAALSASSRLNHRWNGVINRVDLTEVNKLREDYNEYYVFEKECVVRSAEIARKDFVPLPMLAMHDLETRFPPLPDHKSA